MITEIESPQLPYIRAKLAPQGTALMTVNFAIQLWFYPQMCVKNYFIIINSIKFEAPGSMITSPAGPSIFYDPVKKKYIAPNP